MREQLIQYVQLLFAGAADCDDTRQEILQNTLDRYDDLVAAGKTPEAAYRLAIMASAISMKFWAEPPVPLPCPPRQPSRRSMTPPQRSFSAPPRLDCTFSAPSRCSF